MSEPTTATTEPTSKSSDPTTARSAEERRLEIEEKRFTLEKERDDREKRPFNRHFGVIMTASVGLAAVLVSASQLAVAYVNGLRDRELTSTQNNREWRLKAFDLYAKNESRVFGTDTLSRRFRAMMGAILPEDIAFNVLPTLYVPTVLDSTQVKAKLPPRARPDTGARTKPSNSSPQLIVLTHRNSAITRGHQIEAFVETGSNEDSIVVQAPVFIEGINAAGFFAKPAEDGSGRKGVWFYFDVTDPRDQDVAQFQIRVRLWQLGARKYGRPMPFVR